MLAFEFYLKIDFSSIIQISFGIWFLFLCHLQSSKNHQLDSSKISFVILKSLTNFNQKSPWDINALKFSSFWSMVPLNSSTLNWNIHQVTALIFSCDWTLTLFKNCWNWILNFQFQNLHRFEIHLNVCAPL